MILNFCVSKEGGGVLNFNTYLSRGGGGNEKRLRLSQGGRGGSKIVQKINTYFLNGPLWLFQKQWILKENKAIGGTISQ